MFPFSLQEVIKVKVLERARQEEWEKAHAVDSKKEPYNPFQGMKRQATILAQQAEKSPRQGPASSKSTSGQTYSPGNLNAKFSIESGVERNGGNRD